MSVGKGVVVRSLVLISAMCSAALFLYPAPQQPAGPASVPTMSPAGERALLDKYCVTCHNDKLKTGGLTARKNRHQSCRRRRRNLGKSRPQNARRHDASPGHAAARSGHARHLRRFARNRARSRRRLAPRAGPRRSASSESHRISATRFAICSPSKSTSPLCFPPTTKATASTISPTFCGSRLRCSNSICPPRALSRSLAVGDRGLGPVSQVYQLPPTLAQGEHIEGLPLGTRGGILIHQNFPLDGDYEFSIFLLRNIVGYMPGLEYPHQFEITVDGAPHLPVPRRRRGRQQDDGYQPRRRGQHHRRAAAACASR